MNRSFFRSCTMVGALALFAACGDSSVAPRTEIAPSPSGPSFGVNTSENGNAACMGDDSFAFGLNGMASGADLNCTSKDVRIAKTIITAYSFDNITFTPLGPNDRVECTPGDSIYAQTSALVVGGAQSRWDVGVWIATDGGTAVTGQCDHFNLVTPNNDNSVGKVFSAGVTNLDSDSCGDLVQGDSAKVVLGLRTFACEGTPDNPSIVSVGSCLGWLNSVDPGSRTSSVCPITPPGGATGFRYGTTPETKAKCNCEPMLLPIDIKGRLRIAKVTVPAGDATSFDYTTTGTGYTTPFSLTDGQTNVSGKLSAGTYTAAETVPSGWTLGTPSCVITGTATTKTFTPITNGVSVALTAGEDVTCTFTNTKQSKLRIVKETLPDGDATDFTFTPTNWNGGSTFTRADNQAAFVSGALAPGATIYSTVETVPSGWALTGRACVITGTATTKTKTDISNGISLTLAAGEDVTCTFTNTKQAQLRIVKETNPDGDATAFTFTPTNWNGGSTFTRADNQAAFASGFLAPGATVYSTAETVPTGWTLTGRACVLTGTATAKTKTDITNGVSLTLAPGEDVTCTFTNTKAGSITIIKDAVPDDAQDFAYTGNITACTSFTLDDDGNNANGTSNTKVCTVEAGTYNVAETPVTGWTQTSATCDDGSPVTAIAVSAGENVTCTFVNTKQAKLHIVKSTLPDGDVTDFTFTPTNWNSGSTFTRRDNQAAFDSDFLAPGATVYSTAETVPAGWALTSRSCVLTGTATAKTKTDITDGISLTLAPGEDVTCTFTNTKQAQLRIVKETNPDGNTTDFTFTPTNWNGGSTFTRRDNQAAFASGYLTPGATVYSAAETVPAGWSLTGRACVLTGTATAKTKTDITNGVSLTLAAGEDVTCTFSNTALSTIIIEKELVGGGSQTFTFTRVKVGGGDLGDNASPTLGDGGSSSSGKKLTAGTYTVCETNLAAGYSDPTATGYTLTGDGFGNFCTSVVLGVDDSKTVHFINRLPPPSGSTRTIGYWKNWSSCAQSNGGQYDKAIKNGTPQGTLDYYLAGNGITSIYPIGLITTLTCPQAVNLLAKTTINGKKGSGDPIYNMVAQLLGAKLNIASSAGSCQALNDALPQAQTLLSDLLFDGIKTYATKNALTPAQTTLANTLAGIFGKYNEGTLGGGCPTHI